MILFALAFPHKKVLLSSCLLLPDLKNNGLSPLMATRQQSHIDRMMQKHIGFFLRYIAEERREVIGEQRSGYFVKQPSHKLKYRIIYMR